MSEARSFAAAVLLLSVAGTALAAKAPVTVSPGDVSKLALIEDRCPTFSWGKVRGATAYELVVYRVGRRDENARAVLSRRLPGSALSWTPSLDSCLERGGQYAWTVRAQTKRAASKWSAPSLFQVTSGASEAELEVVLQKVRRHLEESDRLESSSGVAVVGRAEPEPNSEQGMRTATAPAAAVTTELNVDGGVGATLFIGDGGLISNLNPESLSGPVPVSKGGTGATTAGEARNNLGAASAADVADLLARVSALEAFTGVGLTPVLLAQPPSADLGFVLTGQSNVALFQIINTGDGPTGTLATAIQGPDADQFALQSDTCDGAGLYPNADCLITLRFAPSSTGPKAATLSVASAVTATAAPLSGTGIDTPRDNVGFEFYAVPLANPFLDPDRFSFAVGLANNDSNLANVTITIGDSPVDSVTVPAGGATFVDLPWISSLQTSSTVSVADAAYQIVSDRPVTAFQYSPLETTNPPDFSYTNEASLLLPVATLTGNYRVIAWPSWDSYAGQFTVAATEDNTMVTVTPTSPISPGGGLLASGGTVALNRGDVLQVSMPAASAGTYGSDPSGSLVVADKPVAVFGGHVLTYIPAAIPSGDHLEEQLPPIEALGSDFVFAIPKDPTGALTSRFVKVVGTEDGTTLVFDPALTGAPSFLNAGESFKVRTAEAFRMTTSGPPVIAASYLESHGAADDPAMGLVVPLTGFKSHFQFLAPDGYAVSRVSIVAPAGAEVSLDGVQIAAEELVPVGSSGFSVADVQLSTSSAVHVVTSSVPVGVTVYGFGDFTSYMYPAGMGLVQ